MRELRELEDRDYKCLLSFRAAIRRFIRWSQEQSEKAGLTSTQHLVLLTVRAHDHHHGPTIGDIAETLGLRHHSAVGLVDRMESGGFVKRSPDSDDQRLVRIRVTAKGSKALERISVANLEELQALRTELQRVWEILEALDEEEASS